MRCKASAWGTRSNATPDAFRRGSAQRLAPARALEPQALFLDEPFANVDADGRAALRQVVRQYIRRSGCALILATQNLADVVALCGRVVVLEHGKVVQHIHRQALSTSRDAYLQALVAESRLRIDEPSTFLDM